MNFISSWKTFCKVLEEDYQFRSLSLPHWWYLWFHYRGRLEDRFSVPYRVDLIKAQILNQQVSFPLSFPYTGSAKGILLDQEYLLMDDLPSQPRRILEDVLKVEAGQKLCESSNHNTNHGNINKSLRGFW